MDEEIKDVKEKSAFWGEEALKSFHSIEGVSWQHKGIIKIFVFLFLYLGQCIKESNKNKI